MHPLVRLAGNLVCEQIEPVEIDELDDLHDKMVAFHRAKDRKSYLRIEHRFHRRIVELTGNQVLLTTFSNLLTKVSRAKCIAHVTANQWQKSLKEHAEIMRYLRELDSDRLSASLVTQNVNAALAVLAGLKKIDQIDEDED